MSDLMKNVKEYLDDPENVAHAKAYFKKIEDNEKMFQSQVERFWNKHKDNFDEIVEKIISKYASKAYIKRWYSRGIEPPQSLYYLLLSVAETFGREFTDFEYKMQQDLMFTQNIYTINGWCFEMLSGQGSAVNIFKMKEEQQRTIVKFDSESVSFIANALGKHIDRDGYVTEGNGDYVLDVDEDKFKAEDLIGVLKEHWITKPSQIGQIKHTLKN